MTRVEAKAMPSTIRRAVHTCIYASVSYKLWGEVPARHAILMQLRFDGLIGFPGGLVDPSQPDSDVLEDLEVAANRELKEELSDLIQVTSGDYKYAIYLPSENIICHFFMKKVNEDLLTQLEHSALTAPDRFEVCGTLRVPCYELPQSGGKTPGGFPNFITQRFAGNALQQLLHACREAELIPKEMFHRAVRQANVTHLLLNRSTFIHSDAGTIDPSVL